MPRTYVLMDGMNLYHRAVNMVSPAKGIDYMIGIAFHLIINSLRKEFRRFNADHVVFCMDGSSWRTNYYKEYKLNRKIAYAKKTEEEKDNSRLLIEAYDDFVEFLVTNTNTTVLYNEKAEADDMVVTFIRTHPFDNHIVISSDSDYFQLLRYDNVVLYDPVKDITIKRDGIFNDNGKRLEFNINTNAKIKVVGENKDFYPEDKWYEYALFLKIIRGDSTDHVMSAYPGVREKGTKNKVGIREAYLDRNGKGYNWNTFMLTKWVDHEQVEHRVKDKYEYNRVLIDFDYSPDEVKAQCEEVMYSILEHEAVPASTIGMAFMKFCGKWALIKIGDNAAQYLSMFKNKYQEKELVSDHDKEVQ
jgi:5'-3' exonuclease